VRKLLLIPALAALLPLAAFADDATPPPSGDWTGTGELGFAMTRGNTRSENLNAKLNFDKEDDTWKDNFYLTALRSKGEVTVSQVVDGQTVSVDSYQSTANRFESGASAGYKLTPRSYIVGALRYEKDDFAAYRWQAAASIGYGYIAIKNERTELTFEVGPGYKRVQPLDYVVLVGDPPVETTVHPDTDGEVIGRGLMNFHHQLTANTAFDDKLLVEAGNDGRFYQNDAGLVVNMNDKLALKLGYQVRYNSDIVPGAKHSDQLLTTNLVYNF
jgi:putative salt-induced outer membrane protein